MYHRLIITRPSAHPNAIKTQEGTKNGGRMAQAIDETYIQRALSPSPLCLQGARIVKTTDQRNHDGRIYQICKTDLS